MYIVYVYMYVCVYVCINIICVIYIYKCIGLPHSQVQIIMQSL